MEYANDIIAAVMLELEAVIEDGDFDDTAEIMVERMKRSADPSMFIEPVLRLMEENPEAELGEPGSLVHFLESFYKKGYEEQLVQSLQRCPTRHTLWMLNRIINDTGNPNRDSYIALMKSAAGYEGLNEEAKADAAMYLTYIDIVNGNLEEDKE